MNSDSTFCIGKTHSICQDYAISSVEGNYAVAIVSDGCSSSIHTDIGSRVLATIFYNHYLFEAGSEDSNRQNDKEYNDAVDIFVLNRSRSVIKKLELPFECLDATILTIDVYDNKEFMFKAWGDGVFIVGFEDKSMIVHSITYPSGYPHYINYELSESRKKGFEEVDEGTYVKVINTSGPFLERYDKYSTPYVVKSDTKDYDKKIKFLAILSDGISSFYEKKNTETYTQSVPIDEITVLKELLNFKNFNGLFVARRMKRFNKDCVSKNWEHYDDLSLSVIILD